MPLSSLFTSKHNSGNINTSVSLNNILINSGEFNKDSFPGACVVPFLSLPENLPSVNKTSEPISDVEDGPLEGFLLLYVTSTKDGGETYKDKTCFNEYIYKESYMSCYFK